MIEHPNERDMANKRERDDAYLDEQLDAWAFNVMLECSGREEDELSIAIGCAARPDPKPHGNYILESLNRIG